MNFRHSKLPVLPASLLTVCFAALLGLLLDLFGGACAFAETSLVASNGSLTALSAAELENSYRAHSMRRNEIATRLSWLWREEGFLKEDYEYSGGKGDIVANRQDSREIEQVRREIDELRAQLSSENKVIEKIGDLIPD